MARTLSQAPNLMRKILLIRRDNIGDLVCSTPLMRALREKFPDAHIAAYVNSYNVPVLEGNPDLDAVHAYTKAKHREDGASAIAHYWRRARHMLAIRRQRFDDVIIAEPGYTQRVTRLAQFFRPQRVIGFRTAAGGGSGLDVGVPRLEGDSLHECIDVFRLLEPFGIAGVPPPVRVVSKYAPGPQFTVGVHISARKPSQRWSIENFVAVIRHLAMVHGAAIRLFWAPGTEDNAQHPGDDAKAAAVIAACGECAVEAAPTPGLRTLIDGLAQCHAVLCSDGGAMHLAAGLGKPIVCLFGRSIAARWHPWGVPCVLLQKPTEDVADIPVSDVMEACDRLFFPA